MIEGIGVPFDLCGARTGSRLGPAAVRLAGLEAAFDELQVDFAWGGDLAVPETSSPVFDQLLACVQQLRQRTEQVLAAGATPLIVGGDHSIAMGSVSACLNRFGERMAVLWIDAHSDVNTPATSTTGRFHGMPIAALSAMPSGDNADWGRLLDALGPTRLQMERMAWLGLRDVDPPERKLIRDHPECMATTMAHVDRYGLLWELRRLDGWLRASGATHLWVSFDVDSLDPILAPGTGTAVTGGFSYREGHLIAETLYEMLNADGCPYQLAGVDVVEVNPLVDMHNQTAKMAVQWVGSLFGKSILGAK